MKKQLLFLVLNKIGVLNKLLMDLNTNGIKGATVMNSVGMAGALASAEEGMSFAPFKMMFSGIAEDNKTILMVIDEDQIPIVQKVITELVGDLSNPNTAFMFAVPITFVDGITCMK
ncbi:hypothetical protein [Anaerovorax sp. IOR16]|uniref:hypothetical protein n=1 Tax=Anaerovorax sp. IOR16 TaxID=2773458 RepID=UPI0019D13FDF|nr:hypothetical protein [Anaerovorax sp. IOR16]